MEEEMLSSIVKTFKKKAGGMTVDKIILYILARHLYFKVIMPLVLDSSVPFLQSSGLLAIARSVEIHSNLTKF